MIVLKRIGRELNRPIKRLLNKVKAKFQRAVLKTIERNPGHIQAIVGNSHTVKGTTMTTAASPQTDALLLAFIRSAQRNRRPSAGFPRLSDGTNSDAVLVSYESSNELDSRSDDLKTMLQDSNQPSLVLQITSNVNPSVLEKVCAQFGATHSTKIYMGTDAAQDGCVCLFERKAA